MTNMRVLLRWGVVLVAVWLIVCTVVGIVAAEWALHPGRRALSQEVKVRAQAIAERNQAQLAEISVTARDAAALHAWSIRRRYTATETP